MIHLTCHLAWEAKVVGPVQFRWVYLVERYLHKLKTYVHNKAHPEGSIAEALPFVQEHKNILIQSSVDNVEESHRLQFSNWISKRRYENKKTQNSGVMVKGENQIDDVPWYGTLVDIVELHYTEGNRVVLFNCDWYGTARKGTGYKIDCYGIITVNTTYKLNTQEPFVLASQATQVFYVKGVKNKIWSFVVETNPRNAYEMTNDEIEPYQEAKTQSQSMHAIQNDVEDNEID
ncbi:hypothetical protein L3X38_036815 [Prunus dulcis]|uniref:DUF4216 domain-containing protein n=1 Tax=Prunus dulcis TaxID=3755 RepID=A0AAD4YQP7_PRUDU|nr:hypothetical protein L3X38_036815 [Prunus dulcis]